MATRKTFVDANSQHRPEERWLVTGAPSKGILTLKVCASSILAERELRIDVAAFDVRAERARRFCSVVLDVALSMSYREYLGVLQQLCLPLLDSGDGDMLLCRRIVRSF